MIYEFRVQIETDTPPLNNVDPAKMLKKLVPLFFPDKGTFKVNGVSMIAEERKT